MPILIQPNCIFPIGCASLKTGSIIQICLKIAGKFQDNTQVDQSIHQGQEIISSETGENTKESTRELIIHESYFDTINHYLSSNFNI